MFYLWTNGAKLSYSTVLLLINAGWQYCSYQKCTRPLYCMFNSGLCFFVTVGFSIAGCRFAIFVWMRFCCVHRSTVRPCCGTLTLKWGADPLRSRGPAEPAPRSFSWLDPSWAASGAGKHEKSDVKTEAERRCTDYKNQMRSRLQTGYWFLKNGAGGKGYSSKYNIRTNGSYIPRLWY